MGVARRAQSTQNDKIIISQKKKGGIKLIFCMQISNKLSYKMIPLNLVGMTRPAHNYPKLKVCKTFAISQEKSDRPWTGALKKWVFGFGGCTKHYIDFQ